MQNKRSTASQVLVASWLRVRSVREGQAAGEAPAASPLPGPLPGPVMSWAKGCSQTRHPTAPQRKRILSSSQSQVTDTGCHGKCSGLRFIDSDVKFPLKINAYKRKLILLCEVFSSIGSSWKSLKKRHSAGTWMTKAWYWACCLKVWKIR